ncbi:MAG: type II toxin-antitoxin system HicB family antitoxin [Nitrosopumilus sp.]|nr:type II toxin-antitoxin system HicB family antitoxin [Nitrosopumilus sp.]
MPTDPDVFDVVIGQNEGGYIALIPRLLSCSAYGETLAEAVGNISEVAVLSLARARKQGFATGSHDGEKYLRDQGFEIVERIPIRVK